MSETPLTDAIDKECDARYHRPDADPEDRSDLMDNWISMLEHAQNLERVLGQTRKALLAYKNSDLSADLEELTENALTAYTALAYKALQP